LIARRVREAGVFSEIVHHNVTAEQVRAKNPAAIILSGGPSSGGKYSPAASSTGVILLRLDAAAIC